MLYLGIEITKQWPPSLTYFLYLSYHFQVFLMFLFLQTLHQLVVTFVRIGPACFRLSFGFGDSLGLLTVMSCQYQALSINSHKPPKNNHLPVSTASI